MQLQQVPAQSRLHNRVPHIGSPTCNISKERDGTRITTIFDKFFDRLAKDILGFLVIPVLGAYQLKTPGQGFG